MPTIIKTKKTNKAPPKASPKTNVAPSKALTPAEERALMAEARALGGAAISFPGKAAMRFAWAEKIQHAASRDAADLVRTPFHGEPPMTHDEIRAQGKRIAFLRVAEARWQMYLANTRRANEDLAVPATEAAQHRATLLRFFGLRYRNNPEGRKWIAHVREGSGDADLVQDVTDILERCSLEAAAIAEAPRAEANAHARLEALLPALKELLSARSLSPEGQAARALRNGAYTLVARGEQRLRAAAEYWYGGTDKVKDYAAFSYASSTRKGDEADVPEEPMTNPAAPS